METMLVKLENGKLTLINRRPTKDQFIFGITILMNNLHLFDNG